MIDMTGQKHGRLKVLSFYGFDKKRNAIWNCACECGKFRTAIGSVIRSGKLKSCGCLVHNRVENKCDDHPLFGIYIGILSRCYNPKSPNYYRYGGRGIKMCERWRGQKGFWKFVEDMGERPSRKHSLDRIDNDKDYSPNNCRWATSKEQGRNRSNNRTLTCNGQTMTMSAWAEKLGIGYSTIKARVYRGWSDEECVKGKAI